MNADHTRLTGHDAINYAEHHDLALRKYADPIEDAREDLPVDEAERVAAEDPGLVYIDVPSTELLTDEMIRALRDEAAAAGDREMVDDCDDAMHHRGNRRVCRQSVAEAINAARAMDDERPFVRVVP